MQSSNKEQSSNKQRSTKKEKFSKEKQSSKKEQFSKEKQSSKKEQFSKEKQSSRKEQSSKEKQSSKKEQSSKEKQSSKKEQSSKEKQSSKKEQSSKEKQSSKKEQPSTEQPFTEDQSLPHLTQLPPRYVSPQQWEECKFRIDSLESWREEVCGSSSPVDLRPDMCDDCFNTTVPLLIDAPSVCDVSNSDERLEVLFLISSLHDHFDHRAKIRNNWGDVTANNTANFRLVFLLGTSPNADVMSKVKKEASVFGDMLVGHFNDHYFNLTFKTMMGVNWAVKYCSHASFFTKMDDDVWINIDALLAMLDDFRDDLQEAIGGQCFQRASVKRHEQSKWYVSRQYYPKKLYPPYCYGFAYVGGMAVLEQVFAVSRHVPFFFVDDVYVGMALQQVGFGVIKIPGFTDQGYSCWERDIDNIAVHNASEWQVVSRCTRPAFLEASRPSKHTKDSTPSPQITVKSSPSSQTNPPLKSILPLKRILLLRLIPTLRLDPYLSINLVLLLYLAPLGNPALLINIHFRLVFLIRFGFLFSILHLQV
ncbi:uncharacterized protein LOC112574023 [Pomacea canaliculata]|uniref:uncharacterized protein LOC112574023 n=1 Tax=Pomacea canaliculata TaxID=400727 RepID=UPI000D736BC8|nr:uncharacterized protein LOC112574023 [Pomacea canaliculata]